MMGPYPRKKRGHGISRFNLPQDALPHNRVLLDLLEFFICKTAFLEQNGIPCSDLPNVMQQRRFAECIHPLARESCK
ncbi:hypothetical protein D3C81_1786250 [compost metagenome]